MTDFAQAPSASGGGPPLLHHRIDGAGPRVLLLHPVGLDLSCFDRLTADLAQLFTVLRIDLRGHGQSPWPEPARALADYAADVHRVLAHLHFVPTAVVGFSFGGMVAQTLALLYPADVSALVISACASTLSDNARRILLERGELAERTGMSGVVETTLQRWFSESFRAQGGDHAIRERLLAMDPRAWGAAWRAMSAVNTATGLAAIAVPTLCLAGGSDVSAPPETVRAIADNIKGACFDIIPGAAHMLFVEHHQAVAERLADFLATTLAPAGAQIVQ